MTLKNRARSQVKDLMKSRVCLGDGWTLNRPQFGSSQMLCTAKVSHTGWATNRGGEMRASIKYPIPGFEVLPIPMYITGYRHQQILLDRGV